MNTKRHKWNYAGHSFYVTFNKFDHYKSEHVELVDIPSGCIWIMFDKGLIAQLRREAVQIA